MPADCLFRKDINNTTSCVMDSEIRTVTWQHSIMERGFRLGIYSQIFISVDNEYHEMVTLFEFALFRVMCKVW
jgi:hypothetical protein